MNMFNVLIIDDEPMIRKGLIQIIPWDKLGCVVCGETADGVEGIEKIHQYKPDILFADINMPEINGFEMLKQAKEVIPYCKFIILSGYREFSYMQEALKLGAFDYLLKPSNVDNICEVVRRAVMELKYQRDYQMEVKKLRKCFEESLPILKEKLLYDVMFQINLDEEEMKENFKLYGFEIHEFIMMMIDIEEGGEKKAPYERKIEQLGIIHNVEELFVECQVEKVVLNNQQIVFIISPKANDSLVKDQVHKKVSHVQKVIESCFDFTVSISVSTVGKEVSELHKKLIECQKALSYRFYMGSGSIILFEDLMSFYQGQEQVDFGDLDKALCEAIKTGNEDNTQNILYQIDEKVAKINIEPEFIKTFYWNLIHEIHTIQISIRSLDSEKREMHYDISSLYKLIDKATQIKELKGLLREVSINVVRRINEYNQKNINQILQKAIEYIKAHYTMPITLNELAEHTYVSTYYLSRMFKKELGKNFVEYLNEIRIEKAKQLLKDTQYKTYEIAEIVGIQDPHYFSKIFKKYVNMTPTEFKDRELMENH